MNYKDYRRLFFLAACFFISRDILAQNPVYHVRYISTEYVYLDVGSDAGLAVGDKLIVRRSNRDIAEIEIVYVAQHSSSCKIVSGADIQAGDVVEVQSKVSTGNVTPEQQPEKPPATPNETLARERKKSVASFSGNVALQWYHVEDLSASGLNFDQPALRINLKAKNLWGRGYSLRVRARSRQDQRLRRLNDNAPQTEWRNRVYEISFNYENENAAINYQMGRLISNKFSGVGYIDGALLQWNSSRSLKLGLFGGTQPQWQYAGFQTAIQKYGGYANYVNGDYSTGRFETVVAAAGEYHGSTVSREFVYFQNNVYNQRWTFYQSAEVDINRTWRKERAGQGASLTNLYLYGNFRIMNWIQLGLSFDDRKNYLTYETRTIADSLFDAALRYGLRSNLQLRLPGRFIFYGNYGVRKRKTDSQYTQSYSGALNKNNLFRQSLSLNLYFAGFSNFFANGNNFSVRVGKQFHAGHNLSLSYGNYFYSFGVNGERRSNPWVRLSGFFQFFTRIYFSEDYEYNWGDDAPGHRLFAELGYRF